MTMSATPTSSNVPGRPDALDPSTHGWPAVPRSPSTTLAKHPAPHPPRAHTPEEIGYPDTELVRRTLEIVEKELDAKTIRHCWRVYFFAVAVLRERFPDWRIDLETLLLTCLWHDIGTSPANLRGTLMSFDLWGGIVAHNHLADLRTPQSQREAVTEAILRHQDPGETGTITSLGFVIQIATLLDNAGLQVDLVHPDTIRAVSTKYPREGWTGCFADVVRREIETKPWAHSTAIDGFVEKVEANDVMRPYE